MIKIPKEYIVERLKTQSGLSEEEINTKIKAKLESLSGLISEEGAAHIVANELGVNLMEATDNLKIKNVLSGMRNVDLLGKVTRVYEVRSFQTEQRSGKVGSFMMGDETGLMRVVVWGDKADILSELVEGTIIRIKSGYCRDNNGRLELHLNDNSELIKNPDGESVGDVKTRIESKRKNISELSADDQNTEILGTIVSAFDPRFFEVCPTCSKRARSSPEGFACQEHGVVEPDFSYVMNVVVDDGSENIRSIFFKNQMQHLLNMTHEELLSKKDASFEIIKTDLLGKIIKVIGRTTNNEMFQRLEFVAQIVDSNPNPADEIKKAEQNKTNESIQQASSPVAAAVPTQTPESVNTSNVNTNEGSSQEQVLSSNEASSESIESPSELLEQKAPIDQEIPSAAPIEALDKQIQGQNDSNDEIVSENKTESSQVSEEPVSLDDLEDFSEDDIYE